MYIVSTNVVIREGRDSKNFYTLYLAKCKIREDIQKDNLYIVSSKV